MRARYLGDHGSVTLWGIRFPQGVFVDVKDEMAQTKVRGNNHFEVEAIDAETVEFREVPMTEAGTEKPRRGRKPKE